MKKIFTSAFIFTMLIVPFFAVNALVTEIFSKQTSPASMEITVKGLEKNTLYNFYVTNKNDLEDKSYVQIESNDFGVIINTFSGLYPNTNYLAEVLDLNDSLVWSKSFLTDKDKTATTTTTTTSTATATTSTVADASSKGGGLVPDCPATGCGFEEFMILINKVINFLLFVIATPMVALILMYVGWLYMSEGEKSKTQAKNILMNVIFGYVIGLIAWLAIKTIMVSLGYSGISFLNYVIIK